jgi:histone acetyltransferase
MQPDPQRPTRAGKKSAPGLSLAPTSLVARTPHRARVPATDGKTATKVNGAVSGKYDARVKVEDQMDEGQLKRLATGVPVDSAANGVTASGVRLYV